MKTESFDEKEKPELVEAARVAVPLADLDDLWPRIGQYFRDQRSKVEPRPIRETK